MPELPLADFFAAYHDCDQYTLHKAVMCCAYGRERELLRKAAYPWQPEIFFHRTLRNMAIADKPQRLPRGYITPDVTRVRNKLETWLRHYWLPRQPQQTLPGPAPTKKPDKTLRQLFNSADYTYTDLENAVWFVLRTPTGMHLLDLVKTHRTRDGLNAREQKIMAFVWGANLNRRPPRGDPYVYRPLIGRIKTTLRKNPTTW